MRAAHGRSHLPRTGCGYKLRARHINPSPYFQRYSLTSRFRMIEAYVKVGDPANASLCEQAVKELAAFRSTTEGSLDFIVPNRFSLDTRVKNAAG